MWCRSHSLRVPRAQALCLSLALSFVPTAALAQSEAPPDEPGRAGFSFDLRLASGAATAAFTESDGPIADFEAFALGGAARFGWFLSPRVLLGAELTATWHTGVGTLRVKDPLYFVGDGTPNAATYSVVAPLGVFVEVYPWPEAGWFFAVAGGVGFTDLPSFSDGNSNVLTSGFSLDAGYELGSAKRGPAVFVRYSRWAGEEFFVSEHPDGLLSRELLVGLRWSFWTPEWQ